MGFLCHCETMSLCLQVLRLTRLSLKRDTFVKFCTLQSSTPVVYHKTHNAYTQAVIENRICKYRKCCMHNTCVFLYWYPLLMRIVLSCYL